MSLWPSRRRPRRDKRRIRPRAGEESGAETGQVRAICCQVDEWAAEHHRSAEVEPLVGEVARVGEPLVMDAGGTGAGEGDVEVLQPAADVMAGVAVLQLGADGLAVVRRMVAEPHAAAVRRVVAEPHVAAVGEAGALAPLAVDVAVSPFYVRPVAVGGEGAATRPSSRYATVFPADPGLHDEVRRATEEDVR